jgi:hypothetical protein
MRRPRLRPGPSSCLPLCLLAGYSVGIGYGSLIGASSKARVLPPVPPNGVYMAVSAFRKGARIPVPFWRCRRDSKVCCPAVTGNTQVIAAEPTIVGSAPAPFQAYSERASLCTCRMRWKNAQPIVQAVPLTVGVAVTSTNPSAGTLIVTLP